jgi:hypothetical protein
MKNILFTTTILFLTTSFSCDVSIKSASIEGGWELVWGKYGENVVDPGAPFQFKLFSGRHFSLIMRDGDGGWSRAGAGRYALEGNIYRETFVYNSTKEYVGATVEWKYEVKGDTLIMEGPLKVVDAAGSDASHWMDGLNHMREIRVRAK